MRMLFLSPRETSRAEGVFWDMRQGALAHLSSKQPSLGEWGCILPPSLSPPKITRLECRRLWVRSLCPT